MKRNSILVLAIVLAVVFSVNSAKKILSLRGTSQKVEEAQAKLEKLEKENEVLKRELEYKKSEKFQEGEIRDKLGLAKEGETVVVLPKDDEGQTTDNQSQDNRSNLQKWLDLFFGSG